MHPQCECCKQQPEGAGILTAFWWSHRCEWAAALLAAAVSTPLVGRNVRLLHCYCTFTPAQLWVGFLLPVLFSNTLHQLHFLYIDFYVWVEQPYPFFFVVLTSFYCSLTFISARQQHDCHGVPSLIDVLHSTTAWAFSTPAAYFQFIWRYSLFFFLLTSLTLFVLLQKEWWLSSIHESPQLDIFRLFETQAFTIDYMFRASFSCHGENTISLHYQFSFIGLYYAVHSFIML